VTIRRFAAQIIGLLMAVGLAACSDTNLNPFKADTIDVGCPPMGSLKEAATLTRFRPGDGHDLTDVTLEAKIGRVVGACQVKQSTLTGKVTLGVELFGERGPALETDAASLEYFVAVKAADGVIASRESFTLPLDFRNGVQEARAVDYLTFTIPNASPEALRGYRVFVGLQMTRDEWEFSQRSRRSR
jgi:hypothetical protein